METPRNNRREPRVPNELHIELQMPDQTQTYETQNISYGGVYIVCPEPLSLRTLLRFQTKLPDYDEPLQMLGMVAHRVSEHDASERQLPPGMGIQLFAVGPEAKGRWRHYVRQQYDQHPDIRQEIRRNEYPHLKLRLPTRDALERFIQDDVSAGNVFIRHADLQAQGTRIFLEVGHPEAATWCHLEAIVMEFVEAPRQERGMRLMFPNADQARDLLLEFLESGEA